MGFQPLQLTFSSSTSKLLLVRVTTHPKRAERDAVLTWSRRGLRKEGNDEDDGDTRCGDLHCGRG